MNKKILVEKVKKLLNEREIINEQLQEIAKSVNPTSPWKCVLRTELGVVI